MPGKLDDVQCTSSPKRQAVQRPQVRSGWRITLSPTWRHSCKKDASSHRHGSVSRKTYLDVCDGAAYAMDCASVLVADCVGEFYLGFGLPLAFEDVLDVED